MASCDWNRLARACERAGGWLGALEEEEFGVMSLDLLARRNSCVESGGSCWLLDEEFEIDVVFVFASVRGSVLISIGVAADCLRVGGVLSLWTRARRGEGGDGILARPGIFGLNVALVGTLEGCILLLFCFCWVFPRWRVY